MKNTRFGFLRAVVLTVSMGMVQPVLASDAACEGQGPWTIYPSLRLGYVGATAKSSDAGRTAELDVDAHFSPGIGFAYSPDPSWSLEANVRYDLYRAEVNRSDGDADSDISSLTLTAGPALHLPALDAAAGARPVLAAAAGYRHVFADLAAPAKDYEPAWGLEGALGLEWTRWAVRLGYAWYRHDAGDTKPGTTCAEDLTLSEVFVEAAWRFQL